MHATGVDAESGAYVDLNAATNGQGQVGFSVPDRNYKVRVDYLGGQYWSERFKWQDKDVVIDEGEVDVHITWNGAEVNGVPVYLFTETGSYLNRTVPTDAQGHAKFHVPLKQYKFRVDYNGRQYWTGIITPILHQQLSMEVALEQLALIPTNDPKPKRYDGEAPIYVGEPFKVASLGSLTGILSQTVVAQVSQPKVYYYLTDHLGTPQKVMDSAGAVVWSGDYRPFGEVVSGVSTIQNQFRFPGQYYEKETGLHYNYHRYYQPIVGRYSAPDPIGITPDLNLFAYVSSNPLSWSDPLGLWKAEHRIMTSMAMRGKAFTPAEIQIAVRSNLDVDDLTNQFNDAAHYMAGAEEAAETLIYELLEKAVQQTCKCDRKGAMEKLGEALHTVQDRYSHYEQSAGWSKHLPFFGTRPDDPRRHHEEYRNASLHSDFFVDVFLEEVERRCN